MASNNPTFELGFLDLKWLQKNRKPRKIKKAKVLLVKTTRARASAAKVLPVKTTRARAEFAI